MIWKKYRGDDRTAEARSHTATSQENDPDFFVQFLENDIFDNNPDSSATIFCRVDDTVRILKDGRNRGYMQESMRFQIWFCAISCRSPIPNIDATYFC
jgi:hypothetical protein